jgi:hypothetical protein
MEYQQSDCLLGSYKRHSANLSAHPMLSEQISYLLRIRVLQEFELLAQMRPRAAEGHLVLRRLTRAEFRFVKETGLIPYENAVAVIVVPPLNRDLTTKKRPEPSSPFAEGPPGDVTTVPSRPLPLLSSLHATRETNDIPELPPTHARPLVPLYNGLTLFPSPSQRAAFYSILTRILLIERRARYRDHGPPHTSSNDACKESESEDKRAKGEQKASHAFLLCSDSGTVLRADTAAAAIALWRVRMWEGAGWGQVEEGGWLWGAHKREVVNRTDV